jgi:O-antigen/teichoic acid export membrane protein
MSLSVRTLRGAAWQTVSTSVQGVLQLAVLVVLARYLSPRDFGLVAVSRVFTGILQVVAEGGFWGAVVQRPTLTRGHLKAAYAVSGLFPFVLVAAFWAVTPLFARFFHAGDLVLLLRVMSLYAVFSGWGLVSRARLERDMDFRRLFFLDTASFLLGYVAVAVAGCLLGWGVWALAAAILARGALFTVLVGFARRPVVGRFGRDELHDIVGYGAGFTAGRVLDYFAWQADYLVVGRWLGVPALGFYQRGYELMELPGRYLGKVAEKVLFTSMAQLQARREALARAFSRTVEISSLMVLPVTVFMEIVAPEIVRMLYGERWLPIVPVLQVLLLTPLFRTSGRVAEALARATGAVYRNAWRKAVSVVMVCGCAWLGQHWGIIGVAWGAGLAIVFNALLLLHLALARTGLGWSALGRSYLPALSVSFVGALAAVPAAWLLRRPGVPPLAVVAASGAAGLAAVALAVRLRPALLGAAGPWLMERAGAAFPLWGRLFAAGARTTSPAPHGPLP